MILTTILGVVGLLLGLALVVFWTAHIAMTVEYAKDAWGGKRGIFMNPYIKFFDLNIFTLPKLLEKLWPKLYAKSGFAGSLFYSFSEDEVHTWVADHSRTHADYMNANIWDDQSEVFEWHAGLLETNHIYRILDPISFIYLSVVGRIFYSQWKRQYPAGYDHSLQILEWQQNTPKQHRIIENS